MSRLTHFTAASRRALFTLSAVITLALGASPAWAALNQPVRTATGLVLGAAARDVSVTVFKGIPYAAAPVGDLRWKPPAPAEAWTGVRKADQFGAVCPTPQRGPGAAPPMSEDCLFANVWTGAKSSSERRPVFVWIYGGGFISGAGSQPDFDGEGLAKKGVVVVTFNYRLGALGFLATPELSKESGHDASGDYGLMDDIALLKWVQKNIAAFGGDPKQVTIAGQSAGAGSVGFLSMSPLAKGLFQRSIGESHARHPGDPELRYLSVSLRESKKVAEEQGVKYAQAHGAPSLKELRALSWQDIIKGSDDLDTTVDTGSSGEPPLFRPVVDGWVLPHNYSQTFALGTQNDVLYVAGNNKDETGAVPETAFAGLRARTGPARPGPVAQINLRLTDYVAGAKRKFGPMADEFLKLYPASNDDEAALQNNASARDDNRISTYLWAIEWQKHARQPVYTYFWTHAPPGPGHDQRGAYHGSEINYVFDNLYAVDRPWTDDDRKIADTMSSYWANIVAKGDPNGPGLPVWPKYDSKSATVMELGDHFGPIAVADPVKIDFWRRFFLSHDQW